MAGEESTIGALLDETGGSIKTGPFGTKLKASEYTSSGVPVISVGEVGFGRLRIHAKTPRVDESVWSRMPEFLLKAGDIVFGRKGAVERSAQLHAEEDGYFLGSDGIRIRLNRDACDPKFIAYQLLTYEHRNWMIQHAAGTTMPSLNEGIIRRIPIILKPLPEQRAIASVLGSLDDMIEVNREINETLEEMARALFKSWFVDFDPVRAKLEGRKPAGMDAATAALFPDHFQDSEMGQIPKGWEVGRLEAIASVGSGKRPEGRRDISSSDCNIPLYGGGGRMGYVSSSLYEHPILFTGRVGTLGIIFRTSEPSWPSDNTLIVEPQTGFFDFSYFVLKGFDLITLNRGSTQPLLTQTDLKRQMLVIPTEVIVKSFADFTEPIFRQMVSNERESRDLATLRDTLLPKLLSGEVSVRTAKEAVYE